MRIQLSIVLFMWATLIPACATNTTAEPDPATSFSPLGQWRLIEMEGKPFDLPQGARTPTLTIARDGSASGMAGINRYSGTTDPAAWNDGRWRLGPVVMTRMGGTPGAMALEQRYIDLLERADAFRAISSTLDLAGESVLLRFERMHE